MLYTTVTNPNPSADDITLETACKALDFHGNTTLLENLTNGPAPLRARAAFYLGHYNEITTSAHTSRDQATHWFTKAAADNHPDALYRLAEIVSVDATMHTQQEDVQRLRIMATNLYTRAMNLGHAKATRRLINNVLAQYDYEENANVGSPRIIEIVQAFSAANNNDAERHGIFNYVETYGGTKALMDTLAALRAVSGADPTMSVYIAPGRETVNAPSEFHFW